MDVAPYMSNSRVLVDRLASKNLATAVEKRARIVHSPGTSVIFRQGDKPESVYYLKAGEVKLTMEAGEKTVMSVRVPAGSLLGLPAVMGNKPYSLTATAVGQVEVFRISCEDFKHMIVQEGLCFDVVRILAGEVHSARLALGESLNNQA